MTRRQFHMALAVLAVSGLGGGFVSSLVVPGRAAWAQEGAKQVRAEAFILVDADGKPRASLLFTPTGEPSLGLTDAAGITRAVLSLTRDQPSLTLTDAAGKPRAGLSIGGDGGPSLAFYDAVGDPQVGLSVMGGTPNLVFIDEGRVQWRAP